MIEKIDEKESNLVINLVDDADYVELSSLSAINEDEFYIVSKDNAQNSFNRGTETLCKFISEATISAATSTTFGGIKADPATANDTQEVHISSDGKLYTAVPTYDLSGQTFDFSNNSTIYTALSAILTTLGATVTNVPQPTPSDSES